MSKLFPELEDIRIEMSLEARRRQMLVVSNEIRSLENRTLGSRRLLVVVLAIVLTLPVMALAAERALPGDLLYPIKQMVEPIVSLFERDVVALHRIDETERLFEFRAPADVIEDSYTRASLAVDDSPYLADRLEILRDRIERDPAYGLPERDVPPSIIPDQRPSPDSTTTTDPDPETSTTRPAESTTTRPSDSTSTPTSDLRRGDG